MARESLYFVIPFVIGLASGGQNVHAKLADDWLRVGRTLPGFLYWLSRGVLPAGCYWGLVVTKLGGQHSVTAALTCGLCSEVVLRSQFFIKTTKVDGKTENVVKGVFDLVEWYQNRCLRSASDSLAAGRKELVKELVGAVTDFPALCAKADENAHSFQISLTSLRLKKKSL